VSSSLSKGNCAATTHPSETVTEQPRPGQWSAVDRVGSWRAWSDLAGVHAPATCAVLAVVAAAPP